MKVISVPMHCFASNCYLVASEKGNCAVIDPGMEPENIIKAIEENHLTPKIILLTHGHYDHFCAVPGLKEHYPEIQLMAAEKEVPLLSRSPQELQRFCHWCASYPSAGPTAERGRQDRAG